MRPHEPNREPNGTERAKRSRLRRFAARSEADLLGRAIVGVTLLVVGVVFLTDTGGAEGARITWNDAFWAVAYVAAAAVLAHGLVTWAIPDRIESPVPSFASVGLLILSLGVWWSGAPILTGVAALLIGRATYHRSADRAARAAGRAAQITGGVLALGLAVLFVTLIAAGFDPSVPH